jgi:hypothetical protein
MTGPLASATALVEEFEHQHGETVRLAETLSLAVRVEPELLRKARVTLHAGLSVSAEADLWFSPLVESSSARGFVFAPDVRQVLQERLKKEPARLQAAWELTEQLHRSVPTVLALEERVTWLALSEGEAAASKVDKLLGQAVQAMLTSPERALGIARWAASALLRLPKEARESEAAEALKIGTITRLGGTALQMADALPKRIPLWARRLVPLTLEQVKVRLRWDPGRIVVLGAEEEGDAHELQVPATVPVQLVLEWTVGQEEHQRLLIAEPGTWRRIPEGVSSLRLVALDGRTWELTSQPVKAPPPPPSVNGGGISLGFNSGTAESVETPFDRVARWFDGSVARWRQLAEALPREHVARLRYGHYAVGYQIIGDVQPLREDALLHALREGTVRHTGWPPFWVPTRKGIEPYLYADTVECWLGPDGEHRDAAHSDFWRVSPRGEFFLLRGYEEDGPENTRAPPGTVFDFVLPTWRVGEILLHAESMARQFGVPQAQIVFIIEWTGLARRELISLGNRRRSLSARYRAQQDHYRTSITLQADQIGRLLPEWVGRIIKPLYELFDSFKLEDALISEELAEMRSEDRSFKAGGRVMTAGDSEFAPEQEGEEEEEEALTDEDSDELILEQMRQALYEDFLDEVPSELDILSSHTEIDGVEVDTFESEFAKSGMELIRGSGQVFVVRNYGGGEDSTRSPDSFPFTFTIERDGRGQLTVIEKKVDTSSFSE